MRYRPIPLILLIITAAARASAGAATPDAVGSSATGSLDEVVVTAHKVAPTAFEDRRVFDVTGDLQGITGTAADILNEVPSVEVDADGSVSLRGETNVTILIDGKPSAQFAGTAAGDGLLQLPASEIEKIEVITNPPAQFKANGGAGIINIITKKTRQPGASGTAQASVGNDNRHIVSTNGNYNDGPLTLSGGVGLRQDDRRRVINDGRSAIDPNSNAIMLSQEHVDEHIRRLMPSVKGEIGYRFTDSQSLDFSFSLRDRQGHRNFSQFDQSQLQNGTPATAANRYSVGHEKRLDGEQKLQFVQQLSQPDETLSIALRHSTLHKQIGYNYTNTYSLPAAPPSADTLYLNHDLATTEFSADYVLPLAKNVDVKLGYDFEQDNSVFDDSGGNIDPITGQMIRNPNITNQFTYRQAVHAAYGSYEATHGLWNFLAGLRVEQTRTTLANRYAGVYPSLHLERKLSESSSLSLNAERRVTRPDPEALNPFIDHTDTQNLRAGNPNLLPEDTQSAELEYDRQSKRLNFSVTGYLHRNRNSFTDIAQPIGSTVVLLTKANLPTDRSEGFEFIGNARLTRKWSYGFSANLFNRQIDATTLGASGLKSTTGVNLKSNLEYHPSAADTAQISLSRSDKQLTPQGYIDPITLVNLGYRRALDTHWSAVFTIADLFNGQILRRYVVTPTLTDSYRRAQIGRIAYIGVVYSFGAPKKDKADDFEYDEP
jgi:outer membrane receptor for ferrienterochelin and colicin